MVLFYPVDSDPPLGRPRHLSLPFALALDRQTCRGCAGCHAPPSLQTDPLDQGSKVIKDPLHAPLILSACAAQI